MAARISFKERLKKPWGRRRRKDEGSKVHETPLGVISSTPLPTVQEAVTVPTETTTCTLPLRAPPSPDIQAITPDDGGGCTSLWDSAYDALKEEEPTHIAEYEALLSRVLKARNSQEAEDADGVPNQIPQHDPIARRAKLREIIRLGLQHMEQKKVRVTVLGHEIVLQDVVADVAGVVEMTEDFVKEAVKDLPYASVVMAGVSLVLPLLKNPPAVEAAHQDGFTYVTSQMRYYAAMESLLLPEHMEPSLRADLSDRLTGLYKQIIEFQVRSVVRFYRSRTKDFFRATVNYDSWDEMRQAIQNSEAELVVKFEMAMSAGSLQALHDLARQAEDGRRILASLVVRGQELVSISRDHLTFAQKMDRRMSDEKNQACLHDLRATDPRLDKARIEQAKGGLLPDSYRWVLESAEFRQWQESKESPLLWIKGGPGKGKTMLLCGIIDELALSATQGVNLVFFFCQATNAHIDNAAAVLRGLIWMLVKQQPALVSHLRTYYDDMGSRQWEGANAWVALSRIFREILRDDRLQTSYLIVDALDECTTDLPLLLDLIQSSLVHSQVKWIVSSRDWPSIAKGLVQAAAKVSLCLELNEDAVSGAVIKYIQFQVEELAKKNRYKNDTRDAVERYLSENANGTFLWVALVCQELSSISHWKVRAKLTTDVFPPGLDDLYRRMLHHIPAEDAELCTRILAAMSAVYRPITLEELTALVELPEGLSQHDLEEVIGLCGSFLTLREHAISFVHQSAKDFLLDKGSHEDFPLEVESVHETIFSRSLQVMSRTLRRDIYDLKAPGYPVDNVQPPHPDPLAAVRYSCVHWVDHLCESTLVSRYLQDSGPVDAFLRRHFLHWLEALCLLASLSHGILSMAKLKDTLQDRASQLAKLARDGDRFVRFCKQAIEGSPLQLYASALIFSPSKCMIRELFKQEEPHWITTQPLVEDGWNACTQTLEGHGHWVMCLASAPDGRTIASGSYDGTIKIWDISTGTCMQTFEGHDRAVECLAFTPDGRTIASGSDDYTVKIWEVATGVCRQTLSGHNDDLTSIAFTPDGTLISGSRNSTVMVWDVTPGTCLQALILDDGGDVSFAFAPDRRTIACGSQTGIISICDVGTGTRMQTLQGNDSRVQCLAFAPDGCALASAFHSKIKIWDILKGTCIQTLDILGLYAYALAFTPDGCMLILGCDDGTVRIWDIATGASLRVLESHSSAVWSIAVMPKGQMLATGSFDRTVKIWDMAIDAVTQTQKLVSHNDSVSSVAFAPDGRTLASGSWDHTVKSWDVATGACIQTLKGHGKDVRSVAFAYDNHTLVSASGDGTLRIWDTATSVCTRTLKFDTHHSRVISLTFTRDGSMLASAFRGGTMKIWDLATGVCTRTLEPKRNNIGFMVMAFTHDGRKLASARGDSTVEIWDVTTGTCAQMLNLGRLVRNLEFGNDNTRLHTDIGTIDLDLVRNIPASELRDHPVLQPCSPRYSICEENTWITWNDQRILWLPPEYRPKTWAIVNTTIAIGCASGRVLILSFSADEPVI